jgi:iron complex outermembrane receptor protein
VDDTELTGRAGLQYRFSRDAQVYATYTRGYKGRAFDTEVTSNFTNLIALEPETVNAYEVGAKFLPPTGSSACRRLRSTRIPQPPDPGIRPRRRLFRPINAGSSEVKGVELEFAVRPTRG